MQNLSKGASLPFLGHWGMILSMSLRLGRSHEKERRQYVADDMMADDNFQGT